MKEMSSSGAYIYHDMAISIAASIREQVKDLNIPYDFNGNRVGISIGILKVDLVLPLRDLFPIVDKNLYQAKTHSSAIFISKSLDFFNTKEVLRV